LLGTTRLNDVHVAARGRLITAIQQSNNLGLAAGLQTVRSYLLETTGAQLTSLKRAIDLNASAADLHALVYHGVPANVKDALLKHFAEDAAKRTGPRPVKVLSDIDDTLFCSLFDHSFPSACTYPGMTKLYDSIDKGETATEAQGDLVFLTARPPGPLGSFRNYTYNMLRSKGVNIPFSMLNGTLMTALTNDGMARMKFQNFQEFRTLYPEYSFVFLGDSGQGDIMLGQKMMDSIKDQTTVKNPVEILVMIHDIREKNGNPRHSPERRAELLKEGIHIFDSYVTAAIIAFRHRRVSRTNLSGLVEDARAALSRITWRDDTMRTARMQEFNDAAALAVSA